MYQVVVQGGLMAAEKSVKIATANVKNLYIETARGFRSIIKNMEDLARRGVRIEILHSGVPSESFLHEMKQSRLMQTEQFYMRRCPRVHFKLMLIDYQWLYVGSANFTGAGIGAKSAHRRNFEVGYVTTDTTIIDRVFEPFDRVWNGDECGPCDRKDSCPVPLEDIKNL